MFARLFDCCRRPVQSFINIISSFTLPVQQMLPILMAGTALMYTLMYLQVHLTWCLKCIHAHIMALQTNNKQYTDTYVRTYTRMKSVYQQRMDILLYTHNIEQLCESEQPAVLLRQHFQVLVRTYVGNQQKEAATSYVNESGMQVSTLVCIQMYACHSVPKTIMNMCILTFN